MSSKFDLNTLIKWIALIITIVGAVCNAYLIVPYNIYLGNLGAILYASWAVRTKDWNIALVNIALMIIYASGLFAYR